MSYRYLYRTEVKGIQPWILGSGKLKEIAGGSEIVDSLAAFARERAAACNGTVITGAAGGATIGFDRPEHLESFAQWWPMAVAARAPGLTVVQAWTDDGQYASLYDRLIQAGTMPTVDLPEAGPMVARSGRTGLPAVGRGADGMVDRATRARLKGHTDSQSRLDAVLLGDDDPRRFLADSNDFPPGYVAVVHADANGVGSLIVSGAVTDLEAFSNSLRDATVDAARAAVATLPVAGGTVLARPIVLGGDDFTILVPARHAIPFAHTYLSRFEAATRERHDTLGRALHACAGISIVKPGWPFLDAHALAESLCGAAKAAYRTEQLSGLAFHRVTTALTHDWGTVKATELRSGAPDRSLTRVPYSLADVDRLQLLAEAVRLMPRGALRRWVDLSRTDLRRSQEHWSRMREVAERTHPTRLNRLDVALQALDADPLSGWGLDDSSDRSTPIRDALELERVLDRARRPAVGP